MRIKVKRKRRQKVRTREIERFFYFKKEKRKRKHKGTQGHVRHLTSAFNVVDKSARNRTRLPKMAGPVKAQNASLTRLQRTNVRRKAWWWIQGERTIDKRENARRRQNSCDNRWRINRAEREQGIGTTFLQFIHFLQLKRPVSEFKNQHPYWFHLKITHISWWFYRS